MHKSKTKKTQRSRQITKPLKRIKPRKKKVFLEDLEVPKINELLLKNISQSLVKQIDREVFTKKYTPAFEVLKLVGAGAFLAASIAFPTLPMALKPFINNQEEYEAWKRFNIPYLKRTLKRLEKEKYVEIEETERAQIVKITERGKRKILRFAIDELAISKPKHWDGKWRLISYDIPGNLKRLREVFREYLCAWGFYPLHESAFLHAYPCLTQVEFLREYLGIGQYVRIFKVSEIENNQSFRDFFGV